MKSPRQPFWHLVASAAAVVILMVMLSSQVAWAQTTAIRIVVPVPPGGANDVLARLLAEQIERMQGITVTIENRLGAGGIIGAEAVSRATPNGNTLLMDSNSLFIDSLLQKTNYHPLTSFEPICHLVDVPTVIAVNGGSPYRKLADLIDAARAKPREITLASLGPGGTFRIGFERLKRAANVDMTFVRYPGVAPAVNALLGGPGLRGGPMVRGVGSGENGEGDGCQTRGLVRCGTADLRNQREACRSGPLSICDMRHGFRRLSAQEI
jgi:tripartite-type tricarboxylate transporter receptor subunit TctC